MRKTTSPKLIEDVVEPAPITSVSFAKAYPEAAQMWFYQKNCGFRPEDFSYGADVKAWFKCPVAKDHIFQTTIREMSRVFRKGSSTRGCGFCRGFKISVTNNVAQLYPELAAEWMTRKNGFGPEQVSFGSNFDAWWKCKKGHVWQAKVAARTSSGTGCWRCIRGRPIDLRDHPEVLRQFDQKKNLGINPFALIDKTKVVWTCAKDPTHEDWVASFVRATHTERCPSCTNKRGSENNNIKVTHPEIARQWDKLKNGKLRPEMFTEGSHKLAFWKCKEGPDHEWMTKIVDRTRERSKCPFCLFRRTSVTNVLTTLAPELAREWHHRKNGKHRPDQERAHSKTKRWWRCSKCSHEWLADPYRRYCLGRGCQRCTIEKQVKRMLAARGIKERKINMPRDGS